MSHPAEPSHQPPANPPDQKGVAEDPDSRLMANARRIQDDEAVRQPDAHCKLQDLDLADPDAADRLQPIPGRKCANILKRMKISRTKANQIIAETLDAAVNHRLESLRRGSKSRAISRRPTSLSIA